MKKALFVHVVAYLLASCPMPAHSFEYDVDWPTSGNGKHVLAITIDGCETRFIIEEKNLQSFTDKVHDKSSGVSSDLIKKARDRAANGCKN
jgi:hypothetical protein